MDEIIGILGESNDSKSGGMITPLRAIRLYCLDCCEGNRDEVGHCGAVSCPLFNFRTGKNPFRKKMTEEQRIKNIERLKAFRKKEE